MPRINIGTSLAISLLIHIVVIGNVLKQNKLLIDRTHNRPLTLTLQFKKIQSLFVAPIQTQVITKKIIRQETPANKMQSQNRIKTRNLSTPKQIPHDSSKVIFDETSTLESSLLINKKINVDNLINQKSAEVLPPTSTTISPIKMHNQLENETNNSEKITENADSLHKRTGVVIPASYAKNNQKPEYPAISRRLNEQGTVSLIVLVREDGSAAKVEIKNSSGFPLLDEAAKNAVIQWHFIPAKIDGQPISESYTLSIPFILTF